MESSNPYQSPEVAPPPLPGQSGSDRLSEAHVRSIARYQRNLQLCILAYLGFVVANVLAQGMDAAHPLFLLGISVCVLAVLVVSVVQVFLLALQVYPTGWGILLGFLSMIPCFGLIVLLVVNQRATAILRRHGLTIGWLGADPRQI